MKILTSVLLIITMVFFGCKKTEETESSIKGNYKVLKSKLLEYKYLIIHDNFSFSVLKEDSFYHNRSITSNNYQLKDDLALGEFAGNLQYYKTHLSGDTLFLLENESDKYNNENLILLKDAASPTTDSWIQKIALGNLLNAPNSGSITFTGGYITSYFNSTFFNYNKESRIIENTVETANSISALETQGSNWWIGNYANQLLKVRQSDGFTLYTSVPVDNYIRSMAFDGVNALYCVYNGSTSDKLTIFNISTSSFSLPIDIVNNILDMAYSSGKLYAAADNYIYKIDPNTFKVEKTYEIKDYDVLGIATDGMDFWVRIRNRNYDEYYTKISLN